MRIAKRNKNRKIFSAAAAVTGALFFAGTTTSVPQAIAATNVGTSAQFLNASNYKSNSTTTVTNNITLNAGFNDISGVTNAIVKSSNNKVYTINGNGLVTTLSIMNSSTMTYQDLIFKNFGHANKGLVNISTKSTVHFNNVTFDGVSSSANDTHPDWGAVIDIDGGSSATITNSVIKNTQIKSTYTDEPALGGGIHIQGYQDAYYGISSLESVTNTTFENNSITSDILSAYGSSIYLEGELGIIEDSTFTNNSVTTNATGEYAVGGAISVGGAYEDRRSAHLGTIKNTTFTNNYVEAPNGEARGGAIRIKDTRSIGLIQNSNFVSNEARSANGKSYGGAIYNQGILESIVNSTFTGNKSGTEGGAIYADTNSDVTLSNGTYFANNTDGEGPNDIYLKTSDLIITYDKKYGSDPNVSLLSGIASNSEGSTLKIENGANLILGGNNNRYLGSTEIAANSKLTYVGSKDTSVLSNPAHFTGNNSIIELKFDEDALIDKNIAVIDEGVTSTKIIKSNNNKITLKGDFSRYNGEVDFNEGKIQYIADSVNNHYISGTTNISSGTELIFEIDKNAGEDQSTGTLISNNGHITKQGNGVLKIKGDNSKFHGVVDVNEGTLQYSELESATFYAADTNINVNNEQSKFKYIAEDSEEYTLDIDFLNQVKLKNGGTLEYVAGSGDTVINNLSGNSLDGNNNYIFTGNKAAHFQVNTNFNKTTSGTDNVVFNDSLVSIGDTLKDTTLQTQAEDTAYNYDLTGANYTLNNSILDLSASDSASHIAGDIFHFDSLVMNDSAITLDVNLYLDPNSENGRRPYGDIIEAAQGEGIVNITKIFIADDNGKFLMEDGSNTKGKILVFKGNNNLQVASENDVQILSWATNIYKYGINSAQINREADSIEIAPKGYSDTDTLRDMNVFNYPDGGNRGFNFIITRNEDGTPNNSYHIYRDLDTTESGNFSIFGVEYDNQKSILSGLVKDLELDPDAIRLKEENGRWYYYEQNLIDRYDVTNHIRFDSEKKQYVISTKAFSNNANASMFELVKNTDLVISDLIVQDAIRYEGDTIPNGSVIYANNTKATVDVTNVDFKNNEVKDGSGGAIANISSKTFHISNGSISQNNASKSGGGIYNESKGLTIEKVTADNNSAGTDGGFLANNKGNVIILGNDISQNSAVNGGALSNSGNGRIDIEETTSFTSNFATEKGGAIYNNTGNIILTEVNATLNTAKEGGFIANSNGLVEIIESSISNNSVSNNGGAIFNEANIEIIESDIFENSATGNGGAIYNNGEIEIVESTITDNSSSGKGGAIYADKNSHLTLSNGTSLSGNTDSDGANDIFFNDADMTVTFDSTVNSTKDVSIMSGLASEDDTANTITVQNSANLILGGDNSRYTGSAVIEASSSITYTGDNTSVLSNPVTLNGENAILDLRFKDNNTTITDNLAVVSDGVNSAHIVKSTINTVTFNGDFSDYDGNIALNEGKIVYLADDTNDKYFEGSTTIKDRTQLVFDISSSAGEAQYTNKLISDNGEFIKQGNGILNIKGDNSDFHGTVNVKEGILQYTENANDILYGTNSTINVNNNQSTFKYIAKDAITKTIDFNTISGLTLKNGGTFEYVAGAGETIIDGNIANSLDGNNNFVFNGQSQSHFVLNSSLNKTTSGTDNVIFNDTTLLIGDKSAKTTIETASGETAYNYDLRGANYTLNNSMLDIAEILTDTDNTNPHTAGDVYHFDSLNANNSSISLDINMYLDPAADGRKPYSDRIYTDNGEGIVNISQIFITDDNGQFTYDENGINTKGNILVFEGNNNLKVAEENNTQILSWATNIYKYDIKSARTNRDADSIGISTNGYSSIDTLRDMNVYNKFPDGGNRGFNFIVIKDKNGNPDYTYNIYRSLNSTQSGTFSVIGTVQDEQKSILSGKV